VTRPPEPPPPQTTPAVARYVALFNARDWTGTAMLAETCNSTCVARTAAGRAVATTDNYTATATGGWRRPGWRRE